MTKSVNEREIVLAVLLEVTENGQFSHYFKRRALEISVSGETGTGIYHPRDRRNAGTHDRDRLYTGSVLKSKSEKDETCDPGHLT